MEAVTAFAILTILNPPRDVHGHTQGNSKTRDADARSHHNESRLLIPKQIERFALACPFGFCISLTTGVRMMPVEFLMSP